MLLAFKELLKESLEGIEGIVRNRLMYLKNMYWYHIDLICLVKLIQICMYLTYICMKASQTISKLSFDRFDFNWQMCMLVTGVLWTDRLYLGLYWNEVATKPSDIFREAWDFFLRVYMEWKEQKEVLSEPTLISDRRTYIRTYKVICRGILDVWIWCIDNKKSMKDRRNKEKVCFILE